MSGEARTWVLIGADGRSFESPERGTLGGYRPRRIYGRLDCPSALRHLANGTYARRRVFFRDEATAVAAGYRPCGVCLKEQHARWKIDPGGFRATVNGDHVESD
jgi:hypothetical protein